MKLLSAAAGEAPRRRITGSIKDFLPTALTEALNKHDLIRRMMGPHKVR